MIKLKSIANFRLEATGADRFLSSGTPVRVEPPKLSPEQVKQTIEQFKNLPSDKRKLMVSATHHPCSYCEAEFKLPITGHSHGMCLRHYKELLKKDPSPELLKKSKVVDLKQFSDEERKLLVNLFSLSLMLKKKKKETPTEPATTPV